MEELIAKLDKSVNFDQVFEVVKRTVEKTLGMHRAGLTLVLAELPTHVGAYHMMGANLIVMNRTILDAVSAKANSPLEVNSFVFYILTHEYLHSLGFTSEEEVRKLVHKVSSENFGADHPATKMAEGDFANLYPDLREMGPGKIGEDFDVIKNFDKSSMPYIG